MTVEIDKVKEIYECNGTTTAFSITFPIFAETDVIACLINSAGTETVLTLNTDYTVTLTTPSNLPSLGHIDLLISAPVSGNQIALYMDHDYSQEVTITNHGPLPAASVNEANDRAILLLLQLKDRLDRALTLVRSSSVTGLIFPEPAAGQLMRWKSDLSGLENVDVVDMDEAVISDFARALLEYATASGMLTALGISDFIKTLLDDADAATARQTIGAIGHALATAANDFLVASGDGVFVKKTLAEARTILGLDGATNQIPVGGGAGTAPVWTTATGSGAPVRATSPTLVAPALGTPASGTLSNCTTATAADNTSSTAIASTAYAKGQDAVNDNPKQMAQGINMTASTSGSNGIQIPSNNNINLGAGDFFFLWVGSAPTYGAAGGTYLIYKSGQSPAYAGFSWGIGSNRKLSIGLTEDYAASKTQTLTSTATIASPDNTTTWLMAVRSIKNNTLTFYENGVQLGSPISLAGNAYNITNTGNLFVSGSTVYRSATNTILAAIGNYAPTAAEVLDIYRNGINFTDKWGSQTAVYASGFSSGVDGWQAAAGEVIGNVDGIAGQNDWLMFICNTTTTQWHGISRSVGPALTGGKRYRVSFTYYIPSTNSNLSFIRLYKQNGVMLFDATVLNVVTPFSLEFTCPDDYSTGYNFALFGNGAAFTDTGGDDVFYIRNFVVERIGTTLALQPEGIQPAPGQWLDSSSNKLHALQPAAGSSLARLKREFEIRWTNTWTGTHEAQYLGGVNQNIFPTGDIRIESITMVCTATGVNVILGDGSNTTRFVASTALAAYLDCTITYRYHDGTNMKAVIDPDANFTGSITTVIKGIIL